MACECAVIGTEVPGIKEIIRHKVSGILVPENAEELKKTIKKLLKDQSLCKILGINARKQILLCNSLDTALKNEFATYRRLLKC